MKHIHQKGSIEETYTVVIPTYYADKNGEQVPFDGPLESHPSIVERPNKFEILETEIPENYQSLTYLSMY